MVNEEPNLLPLCDKSDGCYCDELQAKWGGIGQELSLNTPKRPPSGMLLACKESRVVAVRRFFGPSGLWTYRTTDGFHFGPFNPDYDILYLTYMCSNHFSSIQDLVGEPKRVMFLLGSSGSDGANDQFLSWKPSERARSSAFLAHIELEVDYQLSNVPFTTG